MTMTDHKMHPYASEIPGVTFSDVPLVLDTLNPSIAVSAPGFALWRGSAAQPLGARIQLYGEEPSGFGRSATGSNPLREPHCLLNLVNKAIRSGTAIVRQCLHVFPASRHD